jgi:hypothetical protein
VIRFAIVNLGPPFHRNPQLQWGLSFGIRGFSQYTTQPHIPFLIALCNSLDVCSLHLDLQIAASLNFLKRSFASNRTEYFPRKSTCDWAENAQLDITEKSKVHRQAILRQ